VITGLLKLYLRELPEPLFPFRIYDKLIDAYQTKGNTILQLLAILDELPPANKAILRTLLKLLALIVKDSKTNQMTSSNLAIVLAPNLMRAFQETIQQVIMHAPLINSILRTMIENHDQFIMALETKFQSDVIK
jgi:hypothetical protein